jgi:hypothetical protein
MKKNVKILIIFCAVPPYNGLTINYMKSSALMTLPDLFYTSSFFNSAADRCPDSV